MYVDGFDFFNSYTWQTGTACTPVKQQNEIRTIVATYMDTTNGEYIIKVHWIRNSSLSPRYFPHFCASNQSMNE
jgi:hypothetical protein